MRWLCSAAPRCAGCGDGEGADSCAGRGLDGERVADGLVVPVRVAISRADIASRIMIGFSRATPSLADLWQQVTHSLSDILILVAEITRLRGDLVVVRLDRANLAAAGRTTLAADHDGEPDPLSYLCDELDAQGFGAPSGGQHDQGLPDAPHGPPHAPLRALTSQRLIALVRLVSGTRASPPIRNGLVAGECADDAVHDVAYLRCGGGGGEQEAEQHSQDCLPGAQSADDRLAQCRSARSGQLRARYVGPELCHDRTYCSWKS